MPHLQARAVGATCLSGIVYVVVFRSSQYLARSASQSTAGFVNLVRARSFGTVLADTSYCRSLGDLIELIIVLLSCLSK